jgi:hypothetical protein
MNADSLRRKMSSVTMFIDDPSHSPSSGICSTWVEPNTAKGTQAHM